MIPDSWLEMFEVVRRNKLRTLLTASGVFWGMLMLVLLLGFGDGLEVATQRTMGGFATNAVYVWGGRTTIPHRGMQPGRRIEYDNADIPAMIASVEGIEHLAPRNQLGGYRSGVNIHRGTKTTNAAVAGDGPNFRFIQPMRMELGRWINELDMQQSRKVAVIGKAARDALFEPDEDVLGEHVVVRGVAFQVVGVFRSTQAGDAGDRQELAMHVPFTTFQRAFNFGDRVGWFAFTARPDVQAGELEARVRQVLSERHRIHPDDRQAIGSYNSQEEFEKIANLFAGIRFLVWFVGTATLLSGVVGVSNILLITVRERTSEIGVRRALGATRLSIVWMVVQEALLLTAISGYAGLVAGVVILEIAASMIGEGTESMGPPGIDLSAALAGVVVLVLGGLFAGMIPAQRAVAISPVDALRS